jgi:hypothetical protein
MRLFALAAALVALAFASTARAAELTALAAAGYQVVDAEHQEGGGFEGGALVQFGVTRVGPSLLFGGAGLKYSTFSYKTPDFGVDVAVPELGLQAGLALPLGGRKALKIGLGYVLGLGGTVNWTPAGGDKSADLSHVARLNHQWAFELPVGRDTALDLGVAWFTASYKASGFDGEIAAHGYLISAALGLGF